MLYSENIKDYYLLDAGDGEKLEVWGPYIRYFNTCKSIKCSKVA